MCIWSTVIYQQIWKTLLTYQYFLFENVHGEAMLKTGWVVKKCNVSFWTALNWSKCIQMVTWYIWLSISTNKLASLRSQGWGYPTSHEEDQKKNETGASDQVWVVQCRSLVDMTAVQIARCQLFNWRSEKFHFRKSAFVFVEAVFCRFFLTFFIHLF